MSRLAILILLALLATAPAAAQPAPRDLRNTLATGYILQDRNQDSHHDFVRARIVLPASATAAEIATAANINARLAYETTALNLGLSANTDAGAPMIAINRNRMALGPGQGAISMIRPDSGVSVDGGDASGLLAAGNYFAARYPSVWAVRGTSWTDVVERVARQLLRDSVRAELSLERIVLDANRRGVASALVRIRVADSLFTKMTNNLSRADSALQITDLHRLDLEVITPTQQRLIQLLPTRPWQTRAGTEFAYRESPDFTLSDLYTIRGLFRDTNQDMVADRTDAYLSISGSEGSGGIIDIAARVGLETAGMRLPFVDVDRQGDYPADAGFPIAAGINHYWADRLRRDHKLFSADGSAGEGFLEFVKGGFNKRNGLVLSATDARGYAAITDYVAARMPYLWEHGKGRFELAQVENDVRRFVQAKDGAGQVALGVHKLRGWLDRLKGKDIDSVGVELAALDAPAGLDSYLQRLLRQGFPQARVSAQAFQTSFGAGKQIFKDDFRIPWEVDEVRQVFRTQVLPKLTNQSRGRIEVRVSESPEVRAALARELKAAAGGQVEIEVLSAYKQGYSWLYDRVLPRLKGKNVSRIEITYHTLKDSKEVRWQEIENDTRWLQEIYPIDAVLARELAIPDSAITFRATQTAQPVYTVRAFDRAGAEILSDSFDPKYVIRPFFDLFPEYESVRVTTGWIKAVIDGQNVVDQRVRTDPETFWDHFQKVTYGKIIDYVMDIQDGRPSQSLAPFFDELRVELTLSEPNYRIGIDEEVISSTEALHEDIYFETLTLFSLLGNRYDVGGLDHIGRVLPYINPPRHGQAGQATITLTGKERAWPELVLTHRERGQEPVRERYRLTALPTDVPKLRGVAVKAGVEGMHRLLFDVMGIDSVDRIDEFKLRSTEEGIDRTFLPTSLLSALVGTLRDLHGAGLFTQSLSYDRVGELKFRFIVRDTLATHQTFATLPRARSARVARNPELPRVNFAYRGQPIVQWETPIPPAESDSVLARLATFPTVRPFFVAKSFLGKNVFAADFLPPFEAAYISQAKLNALKPTLFLSGRQHANEVSSTSHILKLGELLATDSNYTKLLRKVNVVLHPITNPDGAQLAYDMQKVNPDFMLHAGYLGALGVDATTGAGNADALYPESQARPKLQEMWLPDIYINMHGYPSHEWVQYFAGYSAWVRSRQGHQRSWWLPRGWFIPGYSWVEDARYPELKKAQFAVLDTIARSITSLPEVEAMNKRMYARYQKYGKQDVENFREYFHNGALVYLALRGRDATGQGVNNPRITYVSTTTEAPDETARGPWLQLVAQAGLAHSSALLRYLATGVNEIQRETVEYDQFVNRWVARKKPVVPAEVKK